MQGASALGQGIAALGAGVGAGIKQRKQHEKDVTSTISRLESLKKSVPEKSPLSTMLDEGINTLSNPDLSPRNAAAMAAGFNQSIDDHWTKTEMGLKEATVAMQQERHEATLPVLQAEAGVKRNMPDATVLAYSDFQQYGDDPERFAEVAQQRIQGYTNPEAYREAQVKHQALLDEYFMAEQQAATARANMLPVDAPITEAEMAQVQSAADAQNFTGPAAAGARQAFIAQEIASRRQKAPTVADILGPEKLQLANELLSQQPPQMPIVPLELQTDLAGGPGVLPPRQDGGSKAAAYVQALEELTGTAGDLKYTTKTVERTVNGVPVKQEEVFINGRPTGQIIGEVVSRGMHASPAEQELTDRRKFDQETQQERITTLGEKEQLAANYVRALELLKGVADKEGKDTSYEDIAATDTGLGAELKLKIDRVGSLLGFEHSRIKAANAQHLYALFGDGVMAQIQKTKGAVSEKEMTYFALISPGLDKEKATNQRILQNQLRFLKREIDIGRLTRRMRYDGKTVAEIERAVGEYYKNNRILSDERIDAALREEGYEPDVEYERYRRPGQRPSRRDTSVPSPTRERAQGLGARLRQYNAPAPQAPAPQAPAPQAATPQAAVEPPLPQGRPPAAALPQGATEQNTLPARRHHTQGFIRSPHVENALALIDLHKVAEQMGYENWYNIPSGTVIPDRHAPGKFVRIP
tara:strand:- start:13879 stop:15972 length:2094 start_codon:yes stop_codon:yes gene_type:complete